MRAKLNEPNEAGQTALMIACQAGAVDVTRRLLGAVAAVSPRDSSGKNALDYARVCHAASRRAARGVQARSRAIRVPIRNEHYLANAWQARFKHFPKGSAENAIYLDMMAAPR